MSDWFGSAATWTAKKAGTAWAFMAALASVVAWAILGPICGYSDIWQLSINTGTTIVTFLMVFLMQNTQNRDTTAIQLKLDALVRATPGACDELAGIEKRPESELDRMGG